VTILFRMIKRSLVTVYLSNELKVSKNLCTPTHSVLIAMIKIHLLGNDLLTNAILQISQGFTDTHLGDPT